MMFEQLKELFPDVKMKENKLLAKYTYTKTGGPADLAIFPKTIKKLVDLVTWIKKSNTPMTVLGSGSNVIIKDGGVRGVVMILTEMRTIIVEGDCIIAQCGAKLIDASYTGLKSGLTGLEFACGIPGTIGGAVFMNAGAYGGEVCDVLESALVLTVNGEVKRLNNKEFEFSYRHSSLQENGSIILQAVFALKKGRREAIHKRMEELTFLRESKQPLEYPSCGSVFKRPKGYFAGKLIQDAGLQGMIRGAAQVSEKHAGFIVNINRATATDYVELIAHIQKVVLNSFGVKLETEVRIIGEEKNSRLTRTSDMSGLRTIPDF